MIKSPEQNIPEIEKTLQDYKTTHVLDRESCMRDAFNDAASFTLLSKMSAAAAVLISLAFVLITKDIPLNKLFACEFATMFLLAGGSGLCRYLSQRSHKEAYEQLERPYTPEEFATLHELIEIERDFLKALQLEKDFFDPLKISDFRKSSEQRSEINLDL